MKEIIKQLQTALVNSFLMLRLLTEC